MPAAPLAKGVIIMCAVLIAAGYTVYENREQVKELVDRTRRKISLAMHTFAEEIMPSEGAAASRQQQRHQPMAFSGRSLDTSGLTHRPNSRTRSRRNSTDSVTLRGDDEKAEGSSREAYLADSALRYRPPYRGSAEEPEPSSLNAKPSTTHVTNISSPFDDENRILFDAAAEAADQHINEKLSSSPLGSDSSSDTLSAATMSEKGCLMSNDDDAPPMIPAVLPTTTTTTTTTTIPIAVIDQPPPLPPRPSHPQHQEILQVTPAIVLPKAEEPEQDPESDTEESHATFSTSQPYWAIQQWTEDVTGHPNEEDSHNNTTITSDGDNRPSTPVAATSDLSSSDVEDEEDEDDEDIDIETSAVQSLHSESEAVSMIGSDEGESEDDRVEFVSDLASSVGDTDGWSEVGSQFSEGEVRV